MTRNRDEVVAYVEAGLGSVLKRSGFARWWQTPIPRFDGLTPQQMLDGGAWSPLCELVDSYRDESFS